MIRYQIRQHIRHGEAGSVNIADVETERARVAEVLSRYARQDRFNMDETSLFPSAPPDRGLATQKMAGKRKSKFRITIAFCCNADGSEKLDPLFIGYSKKPRCFKGAPAESYKLQYRSNAKAWMTMVLFEE
jgi:hypothetical protein